MATASSAKSLEDGLSCSLCHEYFTEPVSIECGHSFCQACITQFWEKWGSESSCPQCREISLKRKLRPNKELGNVVEIAKRMKLEMAENAGGEKMCEVHGEPLKLFCKDEQKLMCSICMKSKDHTNPALIPVDEAVQFYKEELETRLQEWREKRAKDFGFQTEEENRFNLFVKKVDREKQKIISKFEEVEMFLKQQKSTMLGQLEQLVREEEEFVTKLAGDIYLADVLIHEMEEKSQQPPSKFLQDIEKTLSRCKVWDFQQPDVCSKLEEKLCAFSKKYIILQETLRVFTGFLSQQLEVKWVKVTLDADTIHQQLKTSLDKKTLLCANNPHNLPDYPQRFSYATCALGCEGFTSGRLYWEVRVSQGGFWAVGVARESVKRKEFLTLPKLPEGIWAVSQVDTFTAGGLELKCAVPGTVGVYLDYAGSRVLFFDADKETILHTFHSASFKGEKVRPFFWLAKRPKTQEVCWIQVCS